MEQKKERLPREAWVILIVVGVVIFLLCRTNEPKSNLDTPSLASPLEADTGSFTGLFGEASETAYLEDAQFCTLWEERLEKVLGQMKGVGKCEVILFAKETEEQKRAITGVLVLAQGAGKEATEIKIRGALHTLLGISERQICVQPLSIQQTGTKVKTE